MTKKFDNNYSFDFNEVFVEKRRICFLIKDCVSDEFMYINRGSCT